MIVKTTCTKCRSTKINITWRYKKEEEMGMLMGHDGYGLQFEDAVIKCGECGSRDIGNLSYNKFGRIVKDE